MLPAIYEIGVLDTEEDDEATGQVYVFCSVPCRRQFQRDPRMEFKRYRCGLSDVPDKDYQCCNCCKQIGD